MFRHKHKRVSNQARLEHSLSTLENSSAFELEKRPNKRVASKRANTTIAIGQEQPMGSLALFEEEFGAAAGWLFINTQDSS